MSPKVFGQMVLVRRTTPAREVRASLSCRVAQAAPLLEDVYGRRQVIGFKVAGVSTHKPKPKADQKLAEVQRDDDETSEARRPDGDLTGGQRLWFAVTATATLAGGGAATFVGQNDFGSAALVATGGIMSIPAITGQMLHRLSMGGWEMQFYSEVGRMTARAADPEWGNPALRNSAQAILGMVSHESSQVPPRVRAIELASEYEVSVYEALKNVEPKVEWVADHQGFDARAGSIAIEVKYRQAGRSPGHQALAGSFRHIVESAAKAGCGALLIVTNSAVETEEITTVDNLPDGRSLRVRLLRWTKDIDPDGKRLDDAIRDLA